MRGLEGVVVGGIGNGIQVVELEGWAIGGRLTVGGMGNGMEVVGWEGWSPQAKSCPQNGDCISLFGVVVYPVWPSLCEQLRGAGLLPAGSSPGVLPKSTTTSSREISPMPKDHLLPSLLPHLPQFSSWC